MIFRNTVLAGSMLLYSNLSFDFKNPQMYYRSKGVVLGKFWVSGLDVLIKEQWLRI
jgi:hypothetical protein